MNNSVGSLIAVLDWALDCAAAGYGGTRGWEKVYSGTNQAVYRPTTGIRPYLQVTDTVGETAYVRMAQTMSDISTGTGWSPNGSPQSTYYMKALKANESGAHTYYIVGDARYFCLIVAKDNTYTYRYQAPLCFGEFNSYDPLDSYNVILAACFEPTNAAYNAYPRSFLDSGCINAGYQSTSYVPTADNPACFILASPDGVSQSSAAAINDPWHLMYDGYRQRGFAHFGNGPSLVMAPYSIFDSNGAGGTAYTQMLASENGGGYIRGTLPYIYSTPYAGGTGAVHGGEETDGISTFRTIEYSGPSESNTNSRYKRILMLRTSDDEPGRTF